MRKPETKIQRKIREEISRKQMFIDRKDADTINKMFDALLRMDVQTARNLIKTPGIIKGLIDGTHNFRCMFAMHAIAIALISCDYSDILNEMSDNDISTLKECIKMASKFEQQDINVINKNITDRKKTLNNLSPEQRTESQHMILALSIAAKVNDNTFWTDSVKELQKWSDAINGFVRTEKKPEQIKPVEKTSNTPEYWTIKELAKKMGGIEEYHIRNHITPYLKKKKTGEVCNWFTTHNGTRVFKSEHFAEYKAMFDARITKPQKQPTQREKKPTQNTKQIKNMLDLKAFEAYLSTLTKLCHNAQNKLDHAQTKSKEIRTAIASTNDETKLDTLIFQASDANADVKQAKQEFDSINDVYKKAQQLLEAHNKAEQLFAETQQAIINFMVTQQQTMKK